jgi:hypothetical protein
VNPVVRDRVLDICLDKPELAESMYLTAQYELDQISDEDLEERFPDRTQRSEHRVGWEYNEVPFSASQLAQLLDQDLIRKELDTNSTSLFIFNEPEDVIEVIEEFTRFQEQESFETDLYEVTDTGKEVRMRRDGNFYHIEWGQGSLEVPPNKLDELFEGVKEAWRFEELRRLAEEE